MFSNNKCIVNGLFKMSKSQYQDDMYVATWGVYLEQYLTHICDISGPFY